MMGFFDKLSRAKPAQKGAPSGELAEFTRPEGYCPLTFTKIFLLHFPKIYV